MISVKKSLKIVLFIYLLILFPSCKKQSNYLITGKTMGTTYSVNIYDYFVDSDNVQFKVDSLLNNINLQMSTYIPDSELSILNNAVAGHYVVSEELLKVIDKGLAYYSIDNKYDITIKPVVDKWGFGSLENQFIPDSIDIKKMLVSIGSDKISIKNNKIVKLISEIQIDLSSIAKGYAVDEVSRLLHNLSYNNLMVEIGGEIKVSGLNNNKKWKLGIVDPLDGKILKTVELTNKSLATSGTYNNYFTVNNIDYSHLINPLNGYPIKHSVKSVSVIANNCIDADALATLLMINENPYTAINIINEIEYIDAMILVLDEYANLIEIVSNQFNKYVVD